MRKRKQNADLRCLRSPFPAFQKGRGNPAPTIPPEFPMVLLLDFDDQFDFDGDAAGELDHADCGSGVPAVIAEHIY